MYRDRNDVVIPRPYSRLSTDDVIVMDYAPSKPIRKPFRAERLIDMFLEQLLYEGVIHGDLHTGNLGIGPANSLVLYDFGNIIKITEIYKEAMRDFVYGVQTENIDSVIENMRRMGIVIRDADVARTFIGQYFAYLKTLDIRKFNVNSPELREKASKVPVELDTTSLTILRTYSLLEGLAKEIDPQFSYENIITRNIQTLFLDWDYIMYRMEKDTR